jgi:hypothetical protein
MSMMPLKCLLCCPGSLLGLGACAFDPVSRIRSQLAATCRRGPMRQADAERALALAEGGDAAAGKACL